MRYAALAASLVAACAVEEIEEVPAPDYDAFERDVYPILLGDCGFTQCHGDGDRPFVVYGPGRLRFDVQSEPFDPATVQEVWVSYQRARSMLVHEGDVEDGPLLRKAVQRGGHRGVDRFGRAVYPDRDDPSYVVLRQWAAGNLAYGQEDPE